MAIKNIDIDDFHGFSKRLATLARLHDLGRPEDLAEALYNNKECREIVMPRERKDKDGKITRSATKIQNAIKRAIQYHYEEEDAYKVQSTYMYAYSLLFDCSLDYLYGKTEIMSSNLNVREICDKTGLSEEAVNCLIENMPEDSSYQDEENTFSYASWWSELLCGDSYYAVPMAWLGYASRIVEMDDIDKEIRASDRAEQEVELKDVISNLLLNEDGDHKSLRIKKRQMEDSFLGAHHRMLSCVEGFLMDYADAWAKKQHTDYEEKCYKEALKIRKALKAEEDKK